MKLKLIFATTFFITLIGGVNAQADYGKTKTCIHTYSFKFDEFLVKNSEDTKNHLEIFKERFKDELNEAKGIILVYGGKKSSIYEIQNLVAEIEKFFGINSDNRYRGKFRVFDSDYRKEAMIQLFIKPLECSKFPEKTSDFRYDEVEFAETTSENTLIKSNSELTKLVSEKTTIECTPAGMAVGICNQKAKATVEVFIIIDTDGRIIYSKAISGHPLLRVRAETKIKDWKFKPFTLDGKTFKLKGVISVEIELGKQVVDY